MDALRADYRHESWFRGVRAYRERDTEVIRIEVEVSGRAAAPALPARLAALGVRLKEVRPARTLAAVG